MFLTPAEIRELTGYKRASDQVKWLNRNGWKITVNRLGEPRVAVAEFNRRMVGGRAAHQEPDFGAVHGSA